MKHLLIVTVAVLATILGSVHAAGGALLLRPMTAREVYRTLQEAGREDAVPANRVVTQGISALTGFGLGLASGIGGSLLVNLATAGLNFTSLHSLFGGASTSSGSTTVQTQEICFNTRSLNDIDDEEQPEQQARRSRRVILKPTSTTGNTGTGTMDGNTGTSTTANTPTSSTATAPTTTAATSPTTTNANVGTNTGTNINTGAGTGTNTATTTQTDPVATNCIVIEKPARKRRSVRHRL